MVQKENQNIEDQAKLLSSKSYFNYFLKKFIRGDAGIRIKKFKNIGMIAGGTGIAPMYQVIKKRKQNFEFYS